MSYLKSNDIVNKLLCKGEEHVDKTVIVKEDCDDCELSSLGHFVFR